jgi:hypothetical protein
MQLASAIRSIRRLGSLFADPELRRIEISHEAALQRDPAATSRCMAHGADAAAQAYLDTSIAARNVSIFRQIDISVDHLHTTRYFDFPLAVNIETFALCNTACTFFQYPELLRKGDKMADDLVE